jgi:membrane fusion protein (multidrug efflux system)
MSRFRTTALSLSIASLLSTSVLAADPAPQGLPAEVIRVQAQPIVHTLQAIGSLQANESIMLRPELTGRIGTVLFREGQQVKEGQTLFTLEASTYEAERQQAQAKQNLSQVEFDQAEQLLSRNLGSRHDRDKALAQLKIDQAEVRLTDTRLEKMSLTAPFSGQVGLRQVAVGDYVSAGQDLVELVDASQIKVQFRIPEQYLAKVKPGQEVRVRLDAYAGESFSGKIYAVAPQVDVRTRSLELRALIANPDGRLRPGLFANIALTLGNNPNALMIPEQAIIPQGKQFFVYRVIDSKIEMIPVALGLRRQGQVEITRGLEVDDVIVTAGQLKLRPGSPVTPLFPQPKTADTNAAESKAATQGEAH